MLTGSCCKLCLPSLLQSRSSLHSFLTTASPHGFVLSVSPCAFSAASKPGSLYRYDSFKRIRRPRRWPASCRAIVDDDVEDSHFDGLFVGEYGERIIVPSYEEGEEVGEIKLECDESGCVLVMPKVKTLAEEDAGGYLRCDLTGCYFTEEPPVNKNFEVIEGQGWRLGYETAPDSEDSFSAVVGAGGWSIALTASEFNDFCQLIQTLRKGISTMDEDGIIGKDDIAMQIEKGSMWMECSIPKKRVAILQNLWKLGSRGLLDSQQVSAFELRFILSGAGRRQAEGFWPAEAVMDMLKRIDASTLWQGEALKSFRPVPAAV